MTARLTIAALAAALATSAASLPAQAQTVGTRDPAKVQPGHYVVEPAHTQILFAISHMGFSTYYGHFANASGTLDFRPDAPTQSTLEISVPVASISTTSAELTSSLKGPKWFDARQFPTLSFRATSATITGKDDGTVTGALTMHGVTKPVTLKVRFNGAGYNPLDHRYTIGFNASGMISRRAFGIDMYEPLVGDEVELILSAAFEKQ